MHYLIQNGKRVCTIKLKTRTGRLTTRSKRSASFPKTIGFWSPMRPVPDQSYHIKLRGVGMASLNIKAVYGPLTGGGYHVDAELASPDDL
jgi:hypothetical protein